MSTSSSMVKEDTPFCSIKEMNEDERPREKLERHGANALSNSELLAILIGGGSFGVNATTLTKQILKDCNNNLSQLSRLDIDDLISYKGIGKAKAITIIAACELGRRRSKEKAIERLRLNCPKSIFHFFSPELEDCHREEFHALYLNQNLKLIKHRIIAKGGYTSTTVDKRILCREALMYKATCVAVCHNHPSGNPHPSSNDNSLTKSIKKALALFDINLIDHIIIGDKCYYSYAEDNLL